MGGHAAVAEKKGRGRVSFVGRRRKGGFSATEKLRGEEGKATSVSRPGRGRIRFSCPEKDRAFSTKARVTPELKRTLERKGGGPLPKDLTAMGKGKKGEGR